MFSATVQAFANPVVYVATFSMRAHRHCVTVNAVYCYLRARADGSSLLCTAIALRAALCLQVLDCGLFGNEKRDGHVGGADLERRQRWRRRAVPDPDRHDDVSQRRWVRTNSPRQLQWRHKRGIGLQ
jgi:hypothetical protein